MPMDIPLGYRLLFSGIPEIIGASAEVDKEQAFPGLFLPQNHPKLTGFAIGANRMTATLIFIIIPAHMGHGHILKLRVIEKIQIPNQKIIIPAKHIGILIRQMVTVLLPMHPVAQNRNESRWIFPFPLNIRLQLLRTESLAHWQD